MFSDQTGELIVHEWESCITAKITLIKCLFLMFSLFLDMGECISSVVLAKRGVSNYLSLILSELVWIKKKKKKNTNYVKLKVSTVFSPLS